MPELNIISSGSKGNCYCIDYKDVVILVDIGINKKKVDSKLKPIIENKDEIFLFITHEHTDHVKGLNFLIKEFNPKIFTSFGTAKSLEEKGVDVNSFYILEEEKIYKVDGFEVAPFKLLHDGTEPFGFHFNLFSKTITFSTDLGVVTEPILDYLKSSECIVLESNYEDSLLKNGNYPHFLKKRIESIKGHLSNKQAINTLNLLEKSNLKKAILGHISEENNDYALVKKYVDYCNQIFSFETTFVKQEETVNGINF